MLPFGHSRYDALQASFERRMSAGLQVKVAYTYSHLMNNGAEFGMGNGSYLPVQNPNDMRNLYTVSQDDVPNIFSVGWIYKLPFGRGRPLLSNASGVLNKIVGDWQISGIQSYSSGRPLSITMPNDLGGFLFNNAKFPNKVGSGRASGNGVTSSYLALSGWADPEAGSPGSLLFGNAPRYDASVRGFPYYNEDFAIQKDTFFGEGKYVRFEADAGNVLNRVYFCPVGTSWNTGGFGNTSSQCNIPRRLQLALQLFF